MWEVLYRTPQGSIHLRKFSLLLATILLACFTYILAPAPTANAAPDAAWDNQTIRYKSQTYDLITNTDELPSQVASSPAVYQYIDGSKNPSTVHFIYFSNAEAQSEKEATYIRYTLNPPSDYSSPAGKTTITIAPVPEDKQLDTEDANILEGEVTDTCTIDGIGWMVCPLMNSIAEGMDFIFERIRGFLVVQPITSDINNPIYRIWQVTRDLANIAFVIGFLVIIYNYIVGGGMSGYEIRKIIPRLVIAAILINVSYVICAIAVDISNIMGYGVNQLFEQVRDTVLPGSSAGDEVPVNWTSVTTWVLAGGAGAVAGVALLPGSIGGAAGLWYLLAPFLFGAALVVMVTFLILAARQAIIVLAIAIAPLAFAAYILPNTEKWFEKWRSLFFTMLVMFPAFAAVFGGAQLAGEVIIRSANSIEQVILGLGVMVAPLAITPLLLKLGGGILGRIGGMINNKEKGLSDRFKNYSGERRADAVARRQAQNANALKGKDFSAFRRGTRAWRKQAARNYAKANFRKSYREQNEAEAQNAWHAQTNKWGGSSHESVGSPENYFSAKNSRGRANLDMYKRSNQLQHDAIDAGHDRHWREALNTDPNFANLRAMKVNTVVDKGIADNIVKEIDADGSAALAETILNSDALKRQVIRTHEQQGRATQANELIEDAAKANWQELSLNDRTIYSRQLERQSNAKQLKSLEAEWDSVLAEAAAGRTDDYNAKFGPITQQVATSITRISEADKSVEVETMRKERAEYVGKVELNKALSSDDQLLTRAAGIDSEGKVKVISNLAKQGSALHMQNIEAVESYMSNEGYTMDEEKLILQGHGVRGRSAPTETERHAALRRILLENGNNWAAQEVYDYVISQGIRRDETIVNPDGTTGGYRDENGVQLTDDEASKRRDLQQIWIDADGKSGLKVDYLSGTQRGLAKNGLLQRPDPTRTASEQAIIDDIDKAKIKGERIANADIDVILRQLQIFSNPNAINTLNPTARAKYVETLKRTLRDPLLGGRMSEREWAHSQVLANILDDTDTRPMAEKREYYINRDGNQSRIDPVDDTYRYTQTP